MRNASRGLGLAYFMLFLGGGVALPYFPLYLEGLGYAGWQIGVVTGLQPVLRWVSALAAAYAADRWRRRHGLMVWAALAGGACFVPLLIVRDFGAMVAIVAAIGFLHGPLIPLLDATTLDQIQGPAGDYGRVRLWGSVSFVLGALAGALATDRFGAGITPLLLLASSAGIAPAVWRLPSEQRGHPAAFRPPWRLITPPLGALLVTAFLLNVSSGAWTGFFAVHTAALGLSPAVPGVAWGLAVTVEIALFLWGRRILAAIGPADLVLMALLVTVGRWALTAVVRSPAAVIAVQLGHAFTFSAFHLATQVLLARLVPPASRSGGQAIYGGLAFGLGGTLGLVLAGALVGRLGTAGLFALEAGVAALGAVPAIMLRRLVGGR